MKPSPLQMSSAVFLALIALGAAPALAQGGSSTTFGGTTAAAATSGASTTGGSLPTCDNPDQPVPCSTSDGQFCCARSQPFCCPDFTCSSDETCGGLTIGTTGGTTGGSAGTTGGRS